MKGIDLTRVDGPRNAGESRFVAALMPALVTMALTLTEGCGGGGSGGTRSTSSGAETSEYYASGGLAPINASAAYTQGATGAGVTVAVIGHGPADTGHPDLEGQVESSWSVDPDTKEVRPSGGDSWFSDAGTAVAGLIAAKKNNRLIHGAAYGARIQMFNTFGHFKFGLNPFEGYGYTDTDPVRAQSTAAAALRFTTADIVYVRLPTADPIQGELVETLKTIIASRPNQLLITEAGIDGSEGPRPLGSLAVDPALKGQLMVVGSVGTDNRISGFSNRAGDVREHFVVAPGERLKSLAPTQPALVLDIFDVDKGSDFFQTSLCANCVTSLGGSTAYAAALAAGAAAVVKERFPFLTASEIASILFESATDLGEAGVDPVYGHGLINLAAAMQPIGTLSIPTGSTVSGTGASLDQTSLMLAPAFGDAGLPAGVLDETIVLDAYYRPYRVRLGDRVGIRRRDIAIESLFNPLPSQLSVNAPTLDGAAFQFGIRRKGLVELIDELDSGSAVTPLGKNTDLRLGWDAPAAQHFDVADPLRSESIFLGIHDVRMPQFDLLGEARGAALSHRTRTGNELIAGWFEGDGVNGVGDERYRLTQVLWRRDFGAGFGLGLGLGLLDERDTFLGSRAYGAFGGGTGASSQFASLLGSYRFGESTALEAGYVRVRTEVEPGGASLLSNWSTIESDALSAGLFRNDLFSSGDRAGVRVSQPLRARSAEATLTVPVARDIDGNLVRREERVSLSPEGREIDFELAYARPVTRRGTVSAHALVRHEPGHDAEADTDLILGLTARVQY